MSRSLHTYALSALLVFALTGCSGEAEDSTTSCIGSLCIDVFNAFFSTQPCDGAPEETCNYANTYFTLRDGEDHVIGLSGDAIEMSINGREVGVEGAKQLAASNGLLVDLLLDTSFSITESNSEQAVLEGAVDFVNTLPSEALVAVSTFASEETVPIFTCADGSSGTSWGQYQAQSLAAGTIQHHYDAYDALTSKSQTKIYDATAHTAAVPITSTTLRLLQWVVVLFTDGTDTASSQYTTVEEARSAIDSEENKVKIYAIGLGDDVDEAALDVLSEGRTYLASDASQLDAVFDEVSDDLGAIYHLKVLVATVETDATAHIKLTHQGNALELSGVELEVVPPPSSSSSSSSSDDTSGPQCGGGSDAEGADAGPGGGGGSGSATNCTSGTDCEGATPYCHDGSCSSQECYSEGDCEMGITWCNDGQCWPNCDSDEDCEPGQVCYPGADFGGGCGEPEGEPPPPPGTFPKCELHDDCEEGQVCDSSNLEPWDEEYGCVDGGCGDGICGDGEEIDDCPEDCKKSLEGLPVCEVEGQEHLRTSFGFGKACWDDDDCADGPADICLRSDTESGFCTFRCGAGGPSCPEFFSGEANCIMPFGDDPTSTPGCVPKECEELFYALWQ